MREHLELVCPHQGPTRISSGRQLGMVESLGKKSGSEQCKNCFLKSYAAVLGQTHQAQSGSGLQCRAVGHVACSRPAILGGGNKTNTGL